MRALLAGDAEAREAEARARGGADAQRCARALRAALGLEALDRAWLKARPLLGTTLADAIDEAGGIVEKAAAEDDAVDADAPPVPGEIKAVEKRMSMALKSRSRTVWTQTMAVDRIVPLDQLDAPPAEGVVARRRARRRRRRRAAAAAAEERALARRRQVEHVRPPAATLGRLGGPAAPDAGGRHIRARRRLVPARRVAAHHRRRGGVVAHAAKAD